MVKYLKWFYCSRRKWKKKCFGLIIILLSLCLLIAYNIPQQTMTNVLSESTLQLDMNQKIKDLRKNIVDIEYNGMSRTL